MPEIVTGAINRRFRDAGQTQSATLPRRCREPRRDSLIPWFRQQRHTGFVPVARHPPLTQPQGPFLNPSTEIATRGLAGGLAP